jgi:activator of 2-hydroxyglutaryl-CoA dehydratase
MNGAATSASLKPHHAHVSGDGERQSTKNVSATGSALISAFGTLVRVWALGEESRYMYLGIDVGTSSVKAVLMDGAGTVVKQASASLSVSRPHPLWSEQDPAD